MAPAARTDADPSALVDGARVVQELGVDLFHILRAGTDNLLVSPYSVAVALAMTRAGARGRTAAEMDDVLHAPAGGGIHAGLNALTQHVESLAHERTRPDGSVARVRVDAANSLWGQAGLAWQRPFLETLAASYGAGMREVDYRHDPEAARGEINAWTARKTRDGITELLAAGALRPDTRLVLVNAIYLKAPWAAPFERHATVERPFHRLDGSRVPVPLMSAAGQVMGHARGDGWQAVDLPYDGRDLALAIVMPDAGRFDDVQSSLTAKVCLAVLSALERKVVDLRLPRFTVRSQHALEHPLTQLGMPTAFGLSADFSGMTRQAALSIAAVVHEAFISVDEQGTEAAAATAVVMRDVSAEVAQVELVVDRPFLLVLHDIKSGTPLFLGRVCDPTAAR